MTLDLGRVTAVIFDMDGLLLDSERIALATFVESCRECGFEPEVEVYYRCIGGNESRTREVLMEGYGRQFPFDAVRRRWKQKYEAEATSRPFPLKAGAMGLLRYLEETGIRRAVVTSTRFDSATKKLANAGISRFFEFVVGGDQIVKSKPEPDIYLAACRKLEREPGQCLALEDSDTGVTAAFRAGLQVIQVPDLCAPAADVMTLGHTVMTSLVEVEHLLRRNGSGHLGQVPRGRNVPGPHLA